LLLGIKEALFIPLRISLKWYTYILELYSQKKNAADPVTRYLVKIMLNAFGGKFGV